MFFNDHKLVDWIFVEFLYRSPPVESRICLTQSKTINKSYKLRRNIELKKAMPQNANIGVTHSRIHFRTKQRSTKLFIFGCLIQLF